MKKLMSALIGISIIILCLIPISYSETSKDDAIVGNWTFDEGTGNTIYDSSLNNNDGTLYGPSWCYGVSENALSFDGINDYALVPDDDSLNFADTNQFTISLWLYRESTSNENSEVIISKYTSLFKQGYVIRIPTNNTARFYLFNGSSSVSLYSQTELEETTWYHIVAVWDGTTTYLYINGILDNSKVHGPFNIQDDSKPFELGNHYGYTDNNYPYHGKMDEVKLFNYALTENEIDTLYQQFANIPVAIWHFDEGSGSFAYDSSGNNNHGTIHGANWVQGIDNFGLVFDGIDDFIHVLDNDSISIGNKNHTISVWIKPFSLDTDSTIISKTHDGCNKEFLLSHRDDSEPDRFIDYKIENNCDDLDYVSTTEPTLKLNDWHHIAITFNKNGYTTKIYHNGIEQNTIGSIDELPQMLDDDLTIGIYDDGNQLGDPFYGIMDEISIYNQELTANEISQLYNQIINIDINQTTHDRGFPIRHAADGDWAGAQNFLPTLGNLTKCEIYLRKFGAPEFNLTVELREDSIDGLILDNLIFEPSEVPSTWTWFELDFTDVTVTPGVDYFIKCPPAPSGVTTSFGYEWGYAFGNQYDDGAFWFTRDGGGLWRDLPTMYEFVFRTCGYN